jgi:hypothetical protein
MRAHLGCDDRKFRHFAACQLLDRNRGIRGRFLALHLFVPIRHIWLMGEYAGRIAEWGSEAVPVEWLAKQADLLQAWEDEKLSPGLL